MIKLNKNHNIFSTKIKKKSGINFRLCMHCGICTNECPFLKGMDYHPNGVLRLIQLGMEKEVLESSTIWVCVGCNACCSACPMNIDIPAVMDCLRQRAIDKGVKIAEPDIFNFHREVLNTIKKYGRTHKLEIMMRKKGYLMGIFLKKYCVLICLFAVVMLNFFSACSNDSDYKKVNFSKSKKSVSKTVRNGVLPELRMAVAAMISPGETLSRYKKFMDYIGKKTDYHIFLIQRKTYGEINTLFQKQQIDLAIICSGPYANGQDSLNIQALAVPLIQGKPFYQSYMIVNTKSKINTLEDLRGKVFAFTDPKSNTGALVPRYWLALKRETPKTFFKETIYTYSHDNSIIAVARFLVDGAAVDSHIWEYYHRINPEYTDKTRIIKKSIPFGSPPFVASLSLPSVLRKKIRDILLSMNSDPDGRQIQDSLLIDKFVLPRDSWYQPIITMEQEIKRLKKRKNK